MARGYTRADSELSESLRAKAQELLRKNEAERADAERNETEYDKAMKSAIMRAQDEVDEEFKGMRLEVDEEEQSKREAEARKAEEDAKAEEEREAREKTERDCPSKTMEPTICKNDAEFKKQEHSHREKETAINAVDRLMEHKHKVDSKNITKDQQQPKE